MCVSVCVRECVCLSGKKRVDCECDCVCMHACISEVRMYVSIYSEINTQVWMVYTCINDGELT